MWVFKWKSCSAELLESFRRVSSDTNKENSVSAAYFGFPRDRTMKSLRTYLLRDLGRHAVRGEVHWWMKYWFKKPQHLFSQLRLLEEHSVDLCWNLCCLNILFSGMEKVMEGTTTKVMGLWVNKVCSTVSQTFLEWKMKACAQGWW